jgi:hypothetical protein
MKRPFWMHQAVEYIMGGGLIASGMQTPTPLVPAVVGSVIVLNTTIVKASALSAFRVISRRTHRLLDPVVIAFTIAAAVQPWVRVDAATRLMVVAVAVVHAFVFWQSNFEERRSRSTAVSEATPSSAAAASDGPTAAEGRSAELGRTAGRLVGTGIRKWRSR